MLGQVRHAMRLKHDSIGTENGYASRVKPYL